MSLIDEMDSYFIYDVNDNVLGMLCRHEGDKETDELLMNIVGAKMLEWYYVPSEYGDCNSTYSLETKLSNILGPWPYDHIATHELKGIINWSRVESVGQFGIFPNE